MLGRDGMKRALKSSAIDDPDDALPAELEKLATSGLAEQIEQVKLTPEQLSTEEISKLWSAFQAKYRPTAAYLASVILIERRVRTKDALPVRARRLHVVPTQSPIIDRLLSQSKPDEVAVAERPILPGDLLVILGRGLQGEEPHVSFGEIERPPDPANVTDSRITISIPPSLPAGVRTVQVVHAFLLGEPATRHRGVESNIFAFVLRPKIESIFASAVLSEGGASFRDVIITVNPAIGDSQRVRLMLNESIPLASSSVPAASPPRAYSFVAPSREESSPLGPKLKIVIRIDAIPAGQYLVRLQIDGAESPLEADSGGYYVGPMVTLP
jgi:hypothetical protein